MQGARSSPQPSGCSSYMRLFPPGVRNQAKTEGYRLFFFSPRAFVCWTMKIEESTLLEGCHLLNKAHLKKFSNFWARLFQSKQTRSSVAAVEAAGLGAG